MPSNSNTKKIKSMVLDSLFPILCFSCHREGSWLCDKCLAQTKILNFQVCPACENTVTDRGMLCRECREKKKYHFDSLLSAVSFEDPNIKKLVHSFKYRFVSTIAEPLADLMVKALVRNDFPIPDFLIPVPLHPRRLRWRGFNQSRLLADCLSENLSPFLKIEILDILERRTCNSPQMGIKNYHARLQNVQNIFGIKTGTDSSKIKSKSVLLIDDIATTGATLEECAKILKSAGARKVFAAVVARQTFYPVK